MGKETVWLGNTSLGLFSWIEMSSKERQEEANWVINYRILAFPSALMLGTEGDLPGIVTWRAFTTPGTGAPITGPP